MTPFVAGLVITGIVFGLVMGLVIAGILVQLRKPYTLEQAMALSEVTDIDALFISAASLRTVRVYTYAGPMTPDTVRRPLMRALLTRIESSNAGVRDHTETVVEVKKLLMDSLVAVAQAKDDALAHAPNLFPEV